ncbi:hypothetical protein BD309DRAFT_164719 [Dichomitus squalens]|nr:hypothetical protein BD309DRAFT_164719 [Dichomitus squalens]
MAISLRCSSLWRPTALRSVYSGGSTCARDDGRISGVAISKIRDPQRRESPASAFRASVCHSPIISSLRRRNTVEQSPGRQSNPLWCRAAARKTQQENCRDIHRCSQQISYTQAFRTRAPRMSPDDLVPFGAPSRPNRHVLKKEARVRSRVRAAGATIKSLGISRLYSLISLSETY